MKNNNLLKIIGTVALVGLISFLIYRGYQDGLATKEAAPAPSSELKAPPAKAEGSTKRSAPQLAAQKEETPSQETPFDTPPVDPSTQKIAFYNVENLFDTMDDPGKKDEGFTPDGELKWTEERYNKKLLNISKVVKGMGFPEMLGLCEVENKTVLKALIKHPTLVKEKYRFVHYESPDKRGIDCAFLYKKESFDVEDSEYIRINFPAKIVEDYTTRDMLYIKGKYQKTNPLHIFVIHWPSRRGGAEASEPKRLYVAGILKKRTDALLKKDPDANIIIMGDFNDEPTNNSVAKVLAAKSPEQIEAKTSLYNCSLPLASKGIGSYNYRGDWSMIDQIIVSKPLLDDKGIKAGRAKVYQNKEMTFYHPKYGVMPNRTLGHTEYYGGFSDHFPVYIELN